MNTRAHVGANNPGASFSYYHNPFQYDNHVEVLKQKLQLLKSEFEKIKDDLSRKEDKYALSWLNSCPGSEYDEYFIV